MQVSPQARPSSVRAQQGKGSVATSAYQQMSAQPRVGLGSGTTALSSSALGGLSKNGSLLTWDCCKEGGGAEASQVRQNMTVPLALQDGEG